MTSLKVCILVVKFIFTTPPLPPFLCVPYSRLEAKKFNLFSETLHFRLLTTSQNPTVGSTAPTLEHCLLWVKILYSLKSWISDVVACVMCNEMAAAASAEH